MEHKQYEAGLRGLVPNRRVSPNYKGGRAPSVLTIDVDEKGERNRWSWPRDPGTFSKIEAKQLMAKVLEVMIGACFENHIYKWGS